MCFSGTFFSMRREELLLSLSLLLGVLSLRSADAPLVACRVCAHLHDLILEGGEEEVDNLVLLDGQRVEVDLLHGLDLAGLDETTELGDGLPLLLLVLGSTATTATAATTTATVTTTVSSTRCESATSCSTVSHCVDVLVFVVGRGSAKKTRNPASQGAANSVRGLAAWLVRFG